MDSWEERMSMAATQRAKAESDRELAAGLERERWERVAYSFAARGAMIAGPPAPCRDCFQFCGPSWWYPWGIWLHVWRAIVPGPPPADEKWARDDPTDWCHHGCHGGEPWYVVPPAMAA